jgi:hypothetical protein
VAEPDIAVVAVTAAGAYRRGDNVVANGYLGDTFSYLFNIASHFMSSYAGQLAGEFPFYRVEVAVTDSYRSDTDFYLPLFRLV